MFGVLYALGVQVLSNSCRSCHYSRLLHSNQTMIPYFSCPFFHRYVLLYHEKCSFTSKPTEYTKCSWHWIDDARNFPQPKRVVSLEKSLNPICTKPVEVETGTRVGAR